MIDRTEQIKSAIAFMKDSIDLIKDETLKIMCLKVIEDKRFIECPGAAKRHHAYEGGLVIHTSEVLENAILLSRSQSIEVDIDVLITTAFWHDYGKIFDYGDRKDEESFNTLEHYKTIKHLTRSYAEFFLEASFRMLPSSIRDKISHCILAHHGRQEWGSPVEPISTEAHILHYSDMMSAMCSKDYYVREIQQQA